MTEVAAPDDVLDRSACVNVCVKTLDEFDWKVFPVSVNVTISELEARLSGALFTLTRNRRFEAVDEQNCVLLPDKGMRICDRVLKSNSGVWPHAAWEQNTKNSSPSNCFRYKLTI